MELNIINEVDGEDYEVYRSLFNDIMKKLQSLTSLKDDSACSIILVNDEKIHEINKEYRNIDRSTDVISFAYHDEEDSFEVEDTDELGDIFISIDTCKQQAISYGHSFQRELAFLFTHGMLHLLGYDHMHEEEEQVMNQLQDTILNDIIPR